MQAVTQAIGRSGADLTTSQIVSVETDVQPAAKWRAGRVLGCVYLRNRGKIVSRSRNSDVHGKEKGSR